jgi:antitoxin (DNA-binding transcriptional repressor) of toxin-antitoxin stability system
MAMTASKLRQDIYRVLDHVLATGEPVIIERHGRRLRIVAEDDVDERGDKLQRLVHRPEAIIGDPDDLVHLDWSAEWNP